MDQLVEVLFRKTPRSDVVEAVARRETQKLERYGARSSAAVSPSSGRSTSSDKAIFTVCGSSSPRRGANRSSFEATDEEEVGDLLDHLQRIRDAARPEGIPD